MPIGMFTCRRVDSSRFVLSFGCGAVRGVNVIQDLVAVCLAAAVVVVVVARITVIKPQAGPYTGSPLHALHKMLLLLIALFLLLALVVVRLLAAPLSLTLFKLFLLVS